MAAEKGIGSILAVDCGSALTKAVLLDQVSGAYRFLARGEALTTIEPPWRDVSVGIIHAIEQVEDTSGRTLLDDRGYLITPQQDGGIGVDAFVAASSAARPIRVVLAGLVPGLSLSSAMRAVARTYSSVEATIAREPGRVSSDEEQVQLILDHQPDVVCVAGGTDGGATTSVLGLVQTAALACSIIAEKVRPLLLFAGNTALRQRVVDIVAGRAEVRSVDNVRPGLDVENLGGVSAELDTLYRQQRLEALPGGETLTRWSDLPVMPAAEGFSRLVEYLWHLEESARGTLGIDLGAASTTVVAAFEGQLSVTISGDLGTVYQGRRILERKGPEAVTRWVPSAITPEQALGMVINREIVPSSVPEDLTELQVEQAVAREAIREALQISRPGWQPGEAQPYAHLTPLFDTILVGGGVFSGAPRPGQAALMVLDAVEPIGVSTLLLDRYGLATSLGAVAGLKPLATVEALDGGAIVNLATAVVPVGVGRPGEIILRVRIQYEEGGTLEVEVPFGSLEVIPLPPGQEAVLELQPRGRFDVGLGGPGKGGKRRVRGGLTGLIIDARGRPLRIPSDAKKREAQMQQWLWEVGG